MIHIPNPAYDPNSRYLTYPEKCPQLHKACYENNLQVVLHLVKAGFSPFIQDKLGNTCFHIAAGQPDDCMLAELTRAEMRYELLDLKNNLDQTPLYIAASSGNTEGFRRLVELGAMVDVQCGTCKLRPIHIAAIHNHAAIIDQYLGRSIDVQTIEGQTPFFHACMLGNVQTCRSLLALGANPLQPVYSIKILPLHVASYNGRSEIIDLYEGWAEWVDTPSVSGITPLYLACENGHVDASLALLKLGANPIKPCDKVGNTPLHIAASNGHASILRLFKVRPKLLEVKNNLGLDPIYMACKHGKLDEVRCLIECGVSTDCVYTSQTLLHVAADRDDEEVLRCFKGTALQALVDAKDSDNLTAFEYACEMGNIRAAVELLKLGARIENSPNALHFAATNGHLAILNLFDDKNAFLDLQDSDGITALVYASMNDHPDFVRLLLQRGASLHATPCLQHTYPRRIINVYLADQQEKLGSCLAKLEKENCYEEAIDCLLNQLALIWRFSIVLKIDDDHIIRYIKEVTYLNSSRSNRVFNKLPTRSKRHIPELYNAKECQKLLDYLKKTLFFSLNRILLLLIDEKKYTLECESAIKAVRQQVDSLEDLNVKNLFDSSLALKKAIEKVNSDNQNLKDEITALHLLITLLFEKYTKAKGLSASKKLTNNPYPPLLIRTQQEFDETPILALLTNHYGLEIKEINPYAFIGCGLLSGKDLCLLGVDMGFYQSDKRRLKEAISARKTTLELWSKQRPQNKFFLDELCVRLDTLCNWISNIDDVEGLLNKFNNLTINDSECPSSIIRELDIDSCLLILHCFTQDKRQIINNHLIDSATSTLSEYVATLKEGTFSAQFIK